MKNDNLIISKNLKDLRIRNKLRQWQIAEYLEVERSTYAYYELGKIRPDIYALKKLADFYKIAIDDLFH